MWPQINKSEQEEEEWLGINNGVNVLPSTRRWSYTTWAPSSGVLNSGRCAKFISEARDPRGEPSRPPGKTRSSQDGADLHYLAISAWPVESYVHSHRGRRAAVCGTAAASRRPTARGTSCRSRVPGNDCTRTAGLHGTSATHTTL